MTTETIKAPKHIQISIGYDSATKNQQVYANDVLLGDYKELRPTVAALSTLHVVRNVKFNRDVDPDHVEWESWQTTPVPMGESLEEPQLLMRSLVASFALQVTRFEFSLADGVLRSWVDGAFVPVVADQETLDNAVTVLHGDSEEELTRDDDYALMLACLRLEDYGQSKFWSLLLGLEWANYYDELAIANQLNRAGENFLGKLNI